MDIVLDFFDEKILDDVYQSVFPASSTDRLSTFLSSFGSDEHTSLARDNVFRQFTSLYFLTYPMAVALYFLSCTISYYFVFDHRTFEHPKYLKNQLWMEIKSSLYAMPFMTLFTVPWFVAEIRGWTYMYGNISDHGVIYFILQFPLFLAFTDPCIYLIHRALHSKYLYKRLHKAHHKWILPTPFASHAFHPLDGYAQSLPYHIFPFIFPLHKVAYLTLFTFINIWTVLIHDGEYLSNDPIINGAACHSLHHLKFNCNYGQFTTLFDRLGGSYIRPQPELFDKEINRAMWQRQAKEVDDIKKTLEGEDEYVDLSKEKKDN